MATLDPSMEVPYSIYLNMDWEKPDDSGRRGISSSILHEIRVGWYYNIVFSTDTANPTIQAQIRERHLCKEFTYGQWSEWVDIAGSVEGETAAKPVFDWSNYYDIANWYKHWDRRDLSEGIVYQYQVRVRLFDSRTQKCSSWGSADVYLMWPPKFEFTRKARKNIDGSISLFATNDLGINDVSVTFRFTNDFTNYEFEYDGESLTGGSEYGLAHYDEWEINYVSSARYCILFYGNEPVFPDLPISSKEIEFINSGEEFVTKPVVSIIEDDAMFRVLVEDAGYDAVNCSMSWTDAYGENQTVNFGMTKDGSTWTCEPEPPFGRDLSFTLTAQANQWLNSSATAYPAIKSDKLVLSGAGDSFIMRYNLEENESVSPDIEIVQLMGRDLPVARFGDKHTTTFDVSGVLLDKDRQMVCKSAWLPELRKLLSAHSWLYRSPLGTRKNVVVTSISTTSNKRDLLEVSLSLTEVG